MKLHRKWLRRLVPAPLLSRINSLSHIEDRLFDVEARRARVAEIVLRDRFPTLFPDDGGGEFRVYSQNGEDGLTLRLLEVMGVARRRFVEIGIQDGLECNTALLAFVLGWDGLMLEGDPVAAAAAHRLARRMLRDRPNRVEIRQAFVTRDNINELIGGLDPGVLSIDVDGVDYWLWQAVRHATPDLVIVEYNASLGAEEALTVPYAAEFRVADGPAGNYYHGASLAALEKLGREKGYSLVAVDSAGVNAFFARDAVRPAALLARSAAELFRPHGIRLRTHSEAEQWEMVRHLPYERV